MEQGEEVLITRRGTAIAKLVPAKSGIDREETRAAAGRIQAMSKGVTLGGIPLKSHIDEGRL